MDIYCTLLGLARDNHNVMNAITVLLKDKIIVCNNTPDTRVVYKIIPVVAININHPPLEGTNSDLIDINFRVERENKLLQRQPRAKKNSLEDDKDKDKEAQDDDNDNNSNKEEGEEEYQVGLDRVYI